MKKHGFPLQSVLICNGQDGNDEQVFLQSKLGHAASSRALSSWLLGEQLRLYVGISIYLIYLSIYLSI